MNPAREAVPVEEGSASNSDRAQAAERVHESQPPPFLAKTYHLVDDPTTDQVISWSQDNNNSSSSSSSSFVIWDPRTFSSTILPTYFKHTNFSNFIRQLNSYGFKKVNPDRWEFANAGFIRGHGHLMRTSMKRRARQMQSSDVEPCPKFEEPGFDREVHRLRRDRQILMTELVKLRQLQKTTRAHIRSMEQRLRKTELKQQQTTRFLAKAIRNPDFMQRFSGAKDTREEDEHSFSTEMRSTDQEEPGALRGFTEKEIQDYVDISDYEVSDVVVWEKENVLPVAEEGEHDQEQLVGEFLNDWIKEELRQVNVEEEYEDVQADHLEMICFEE
uniref:HSF-type DNA-binding domain-containing protein n=1 Tax=Kalanchoe fedtschenkoi TaxID=63787 RepID=A0A7N0TFN5_KALFE